jgi:hypothetical protein
VIHLIFQVAFSAWITIHVNDSVWYWWIMEILDSVQILVSVFAIVGALKKSFLLLSSVRE